MTDYAFADTPEPILQDLNFRLEKHLDEVTEGRSLHLEAYAAAYLKLTGLSPDEVELVEERKWTPDGMTIRWYFREKS